MQHVTAALVTVAFQRMRYSIWFNSKNTLQPSPFHNERNHFWPPLRLAPKRRNTDAGKADIKAGKVPCEWKTSRRSCARGSRCALYVLEWPWPTRKQRRSCATSPFCPFGHKNHASIDRLHPWTPVTGAPRSMTGARGCSCAQSASPHPEQDRQSQPRLLSHALRVATGRTASMTAKVAGNRAVMPSSAPGINSNDGNRGHPPHIKPAATSAAGQSPKCW